MDAFIITSQTNSQKPTRRNSAASAPTSEQSTTMVQTTVPVVSTNTNRPRVIRPEHVPNVYHQSTLPLRRRQARNQEGCVLL